MVADHTGRCNLNLLDQLLFISIDRIQPVHHVMQVHMGGRIPERTQRVHGTKRFFAAPFQSAIHALRLIHNYNGPGGPDQVNRLGVARFLTVFVEIVDVFFVDGTHGHHHDLDIGTGGKVADLAQLARVIQKEFKRGVGVKAPEVLFRDLQRLVHPLFDGHRGDHNHEFGEAIPPVQLENGPQVHIGLARAGLHFNREIPGLEFGRRGQAVPELHGVQVAQHLIVQQPQPVANPQIALKPLQRRRIGTKRKRHRELGAARLLTPEQVAHRLNGRKLIIQIRFKVQFHRRRLSFTSCARWSGHVAEEWP